MVTQAVCTTALSNSVGDRVVGTSLSVIWGHARRRLVVARLLDESVGVAAGRVLALGDALGPQVGSAPTSAFRTSSIDELAATERGDVGRRASCPLVKQSQLPLFYGNPLALGVLPSRVRAPTG